MNPQVRDQPGQHSKTISQKKKKKKDERKEELPSLVRNVVLSSETWIQILNNLLHGFVALSKLLDLSVLLEILVLIWL
jgi:hypothetical protein